MARTLAPLPQGSPISDYISLGVIAKTFPPRRIQAVLSAAGKASKRQGDLPAQVALCCVIALALVHAVFLPDKCCGACWKGCSGWPLGDFPGAFAAGSLPAPRRLHDEVVQPIARAKSKGAGYRQWRLASVDGRTPGIAGQKRNAAGRGRRAGARDCPPPGRAARQRAGLSFTDDDSGPRESPGRRGSRPAFFSPRRPSCPPQASPRCR